MGKWVKYLLLVTSVLAGTGSSLAQSNSSEAEVSERELKAAIVLNLVRFISWGDKSMGAEFNLCLLEDSTAFSAFEALNGKEVQGLRTEIKALRLEEMNHETCHLIYFSDAFEDEVSLRNFGNMGILTIGNDDGFVASGGGIVLKRVGQRVQFSISQTQLTLAGLKPSSKILQLATEVH